MPVGKRKGLKKAENAEGKVKTGHTFMQQQQRAAVSGADNFHTVSDKRENFSCISLSHFFYFFTVPSIFHILSFLFFIYFPFVSLFYLTFTFEEVTVW